MQRILIAIFTFLSCLSFSQKTTTFFFHLDKNTIKYKTTSDSIDLKVYQHKALTSFKTEGYVGITITDSTQKKNEYHFWMTFEKRYKKVILTNANQKYSTDFRNTYSQINKKITTLENNGYPFAQILITHQSEKNNSLILDFKIDSGQFIIIDKIHLKSQDKFNEKTILNLIDLRTGEPYNENRLKKITQILLASGLYSTLREPEVLFKKGKAEIFIYFKKSKSSSADGYVGLLQDKTTQKVTLNGYVNLHLKNALNRGELINLNWKSNPDKTQNLKFNFAYPFIFNTPFGVETDLNLHKQDSSFVKSLANFGINYQQAFYEIGIYNQIENSNVLIKNSIYNILTYSKNTIGLKVLLKPQFVGKFNFYRPKIEVKNGFFSYKSDSINSVSNVSNFKYKIQVEQKFKFLNYFSFTNTSGYQGLNSSYTLSRNELVYFGGLKSVRGFYELELVGNSIFTALNEIEYQPISSLSFKLIYDYSSFKNGNQFFTNSFGFGFGLLNENSVLEIIIANGSINNAQLDFANTKIHIGFSSSF